MAKKKDDAAEPVVDKRTRLEQIVKDFRADNPDVTLGFGSDPNIQERINYSKTPTPVPTLDPLLDGGVPNGKITVAFGPQSSGKTTFCYQTLGNFQHMFPDRYALILDAENCADRRWMELQGIDLSKVIILPGENDLEALGDAVVKIMREAGKDIGFLLVDSVGALVPRVEYLGKKADRGDKDGASLSDDSMAVIARKMGQFLRKTNILFAKNQVTAMFIAHVYADLSQAGHGRLVMKGGNSLRHFSHVQLRFSQRSDDVFKESVLCTDGETREVRTGFYVAISVDKTRQSGHQYAEIIAPFRIGMGFDTTLAVVNAGIGYGIIEQSGAWFSFRGEKIGQGIRKVLEFLKSNDEIRLKIRTELTRVLASEAMDQKPNEASEEKPLSTGE